MTNHWLDELASKHVDMPSPGVESRLLQEIAAQQKRINALESKISEIRSAAEECVYEPLGYGDEFTINYAIEASEVMGIIFDIASDALNRKEDTK